MRSYRYAIVPYDLREEFRLRAHVRDLVGSLSASSWVVLTWSLHKLLLQRVRALGDDAVARLIKAEREAAAVAPERGINYLRIKLGLQLDGAGDGLDALLSEGDRPVIRKLAVGLAGREVSTVKELDCVRGDVRARVVVELAAGAKVRFT